MPIFEYRCSDCGNKFEKLVRRADADVECPSCPPVAAKPKSEPTRKFEVQYSTFAAHANGSPKAAASAGMPACAGGMCPTPGMCGRN